MEHAFADDTGLDGPGEVLGFGCVSPWMTNFSFDTVMTRNPSYQQIEDLFWS